MEKRSWEPAASIDFLRMAASSVRYLFRSGRGCVNPCKGVEAPSLRRQFGKKKVGDDENVKW